MIAWPLSRLAGAAARICGATPETASCVRLLVAGICVPVDPVGGIIASGHALAAEEARTGNQKARIINSSLNVACLIAGAPCEAPLPNEPVA